MESPEFRYLESLQQIPSILSYFPVEHWDKLTEEYLHYLHHNYGAFRRIQTERYFGAESLAGKSLLESFLLRKQAIRELCDAFQARDSLDREGTAASETIRNNMATWIADCKRWAAIFELKFKGSGNGLRYVVDVINAMLVRWNGGKLGKKRRGRGSEEMDYRFDPNSIMEEVQQWLLPPSEIEALWQQETEEDLEVILMQRTRKCWDQTLKKMPL